MIFDVQVPVQVEARFCLPCLSPYSCYVCRTDTNLIWLKREDHMVFHSQRAGPHVARERAMVLESRKEQKLSGIGEGERGDINE